MGGYVHEMFNRDESKLSAIYLEKSTLYRVSKCQLRRHQGDSISDQLNPRVAKVPPGVVS